MRSILAIATAGSLAFGAHHAASTGWHAYKPRPHRPHVSHVHVSNLGLYHSHGRRK
jgi:hypothetical protein